MGFCIYFLGHSSEARMPLELLHWSGHSGDVFKILGSFKLELVSNWTLNDTSRCHQAQGTPCPFSLTSPMHGVGGRLILRWIHTWPWFLWLGRPQNSAMDGTNGGLSHASQTPRFKVSLCLLVSVWLWEDDLSCLSNCLLISVPEILPTGAKYYVHKSSFLLKLLR